ncbi:MAG: TRAP transporter large permease [Bacteroidota bacterium]
MDYFGILVLVVSFVVLLVLGVPIAFSIGISGILTMLVSIDAMPAFTTFAHRMATGLDSFTLLAIPFFILAGNIMNHGGIALRLIDFARVIVGRFPGGLAFVNILANMLFGAISGSAAASASAIGTIMTPEMKREGYDKNFSAALNITSSTTGLSIPPSNILIVYSLASGGVSIAALFIAGYLPGILTGSSLMLVAALFAIRKKYAVTKEHSVADIAVALSTLLIIVAYAYIYFNTGFHWVFLIVFWFWLRSVLASINPRIEKFPWDVAALTLTVIVSAVIQFKAFPLWMAAAVIMGVALLLLKRKGFLTILIQTVLMGIAINLYSPNHIITSSVLGASAILYAFIRFTGKDELHTYLKGTVKLFSAIPSLFLLVVVIGGIIAGIFTATEASAVAVLYAFVLAFIYKEIKIKDLPEILINSVRTTSIVLLLVAASIGLSWIMSFENIPQTVSDGLLTISNNPLIILLIINLILLVVGTFMDMTPAVLIFTPIFLPIVTAQLGLDPIHFGIIMVLNLSVGLCTPPVGSVLFIGCSVANVPIARVIKPLLPMFIAMIVSLLLVTYIPEISLWLPGLFGF